MERKYDLYISSKDHPNLIAELAEESNRNVQRLQGDNKGTSIVAVVDGRIITVEFYPDKTIVHVAALIQPDAQVNAEAIIFNAVMLSEGGYNYSVRKVGQSYTVMISVYREPYSKDVETVLRDMLDHLAELLA